MPIPRPTGPPQYAEPKPIVKPVPIGATARTAVVRLSGTQAGNWLSPTRVGAFGSARRPRRADVTAPFTPEIAGALPISPPISPPSGTPPLPTVPLTQAELLAEMARKALEERRKIKPR